VRAQLLQHPIENLRAVATEAEWTKTRELVKNVEVSDAALSYAVQLVMQTRENPHLALGASPRASIALIRCAQAYAMLSNEQFVKPDVIKYIAPAVLEHRLALTTKSRLE